MNLPLSRASQSFHKQAGVATTSEGALLGLILGTVARRIPFLSALLVSNPAAYDAALGASVATMLKPEEPGHPTLMPGQNQEPTFIQPPPWNLL